MTEQVDLMIRNAYVLTMDERGSVLPRGAIAVSAGRIVAVGEDADMAARFAPSESIDASGAPVHPGLIECHLHASYHMHRGALPDQLAEDDVYDDLDWTFLDGVNDHEEYLGTALASVEMIRNGTTCFMEAGTTFSTDSAAAAAEAVGIRAILGDTFIMDHPNGFAMGKREDGPPPERRKVDRATDSLESALSRMGGELRRNVDPDALVTGHIAVLGLGTASLELLIEAKRLADSAGVQLNLHQSYSPADVDSDRRRLGADPLVSLASAGVLGPNVTLAHVNLLTDAECEAVLDTGVNLAWAPAASMMWGHGGSIHGRHAELWRRGAQIVLGSDSGNWSNSFDLFRQADLALLTSRDSHLDRRYLGAEDGLEMMTRGAAQAVGMADQIGTIEVGKRADIVIHDLGRVELNPPTNMIRNLIHSAGSKSVHTVIVDGRTVLREGTFVNLDEHALIREASRAALDMLDRWDYEVVDNVRRPRASRGRR